MQRVNQITGKTIPSYSVDLMDKKGLQDLFSKVCSNCVLFGFCVNGCLVDLLGLVLKKRLTGQTEKYKDKMTLTNKAPKTKRIKFANNIDPDEQAATSSGSTLFPLDFEFPVLLTLDETLKFCRSKFCRLLFWCFRG